MLRPENPRPYRTLSFAYLQFYVPGFSQRLGIQLGGHGQELNRPTLNDDAAVLMLAISLMLEVGKYRCERYSPDFPRVDGRSNETRTSKSSVRVAST